jgi:acyl-CoA reductase-like NAD-dependent aldehyde dehydrogenase
MATNGHSSDFTVPLLINGKEITTSTTFEVTSPSTHKPIWKCASASVQDAQSAIDAAVAAFPAWSKTKPAQKRDIFLKAAEVLAARGKECTKYMCDETGALENFAGFNLMTAGEMLKDVAGRVSSIMGSIPICAQEGTSALVLKEPYGVVLGMAPWNAPYILGVRSVLYALAAGNTCVMKGSELSPRCFWVIGDILKEAGLPEGALNVVYCQPKDAAEVTTSIIENPAIKKVSLYCLVQPQSPE